MFQTTNIPHVVDADVLVVVYHGWDFLLIILIEEIYLKIVFSMEFWCFSRNYVSWVELPDELSWGGHMSLQYMSEIICFDCIGRLFWHFLVEFQTNVSCKHIDFF